MPEQPAAWVTLNALERFPIELEAAFRTAHQTTEIGGFRLSARSADALMAHLDARMAYLASPERVHA